ncbi:alpha/beta hydrolase family protein [Hyphomonas oceanitis]|uniref:S9A/B/C family peptidase n=1 Tax=Hyphomonas oceanitis SCH89 TaxID=1280953 RepID=A0A059GA51_9PROT|nr:S9 family peptidase [Hyphomonas oceanitis]KDA03701.1 S9A/B/C family peptidase [Hyphomonas oceanitis SCH89]
MTFRHILLAGVSVMLAAGSAVAKDDEAPSRRFTADRVFDMEYATDPQVSPDGKRIAYVRHSMDRMTDKDTGQIWVIDLATGSNRPLVSGSTGASSPRWSPDGTRLIYATATDGKPEVRLLYLDSGRSFPLAQFLEGPSEAVWSPDGKHVAFSMFVKGEAPSFAKAPTPPEGATWNDGVKVIDKLTFRFDGAGYLEYGATQVFVLPVDGGTPRQVTFGDAEMQSPEWLDNDTLLVSGNTAEDRDLDPVESEIYAVELADLSIKPLTTRDGPDTSPVVSPDGKTIAYRGFDDKTLSYQQADLYLMDADGSNQRPLAADFAGDIGETVWAPDGKSLFVMSEDHGVLSVYKINLNGKVSQVVTGLGGASIGRPYADGSFSVSGGKKPVIAYTAGFTDKPSEIAVIGANGKDAKVLTDLNADVLPYLDMARIEEVKVSSKHDGKEIEAWVALPPDFKADGSFPLILEIHGGPYSMYGPFFASEIQRYAAEGYVTIWSNPRGSTGYGEDFALEIDQAYPGHDYDDLMTVVDEMVARKYADPERLFVTGGSGGGILTAWIVTQTDRFVAAASVKPVINWMTMALAGDIAQVVRRHWIRAEPWSDPEAFLKHSPIRFVDKVVTPTMIVVGEEDYRTPAWEAEQFYTALKMRGVDTVYVRVPGSPHYIASRPSRLIAKTDNIMGWFAKYDPAKKDEAKEKAGDE